MQWMLVNLALEMDQERKCLVAPPASFPGFEMVGNNIKQAQQNYGGYYKVVGALPDKFVPVI